MRQVWLNKDDFEMFHQDISPLDYEFFRTHVDTFKRMWKEQTKRFWSLFLSTFEHFIWKHGCIKDFPMKSAEVHKYVDDILQYIRDQFVNGKVSSAKNLIYDCVVVTQNRHCITILDRAAYTQNPFYMKETREVFRQLFGAPNDKKTYMKVLCGLPMYVKFAGSVVVALRRWMDAPEINPEDETTKRNYFDNIYKRHKPITEFMGTEYMGEDLERLGQMIDKDIAGLARDKAEASATAEINETEKKKRKRKKKAAKSSSTDPALTSDSATATAAADEKTKASDSDKPAETSHTPLTPKNADSLKTDMDSSPETEGGSESANCKDKASELANPGSAACTRPESSENSKSDSDTLDKERETSDGPSKSDEVKLTETKSKAEEEQGADSAIGSDPPKLNDLSNIIVSESKGTSAMKQKMVKKSISKESTGSAESEGGEELVAKEEGEVAKDMATGGDGVAARKKLHTCGLCGQEEVTAKTFKRCQKCRGKSNPKYYCSKDCQVKDWKTHKLDHKDEP